MQPPGERRVRTENHSYGCRRAGNPRRRSSLRVWVGAAGDSGALYRLCYEPALSRLWRLPRPQQRRVTGAVASSRAATHCGRRAKAAPTLSLVLV